MGLTKDQTRLLFQGISQQPEELRKPGQVHDAWNMLFNARDGCSKRYGSWFVASVAGLAVGSNVRLHPIERDDQEQYLVVYGAGVLRVFEIGKLEATVTVSGDAQTYLDTNAATANDLSLITIGDTTIIVNTTVETGAQASPNYTIAGNARDANVLFSTNPTSGTYWQTRDDTDVEPAGYWLYDISSGGGGTFATYRGPGNGEGGNGANFATPSGYWDDTGGTSVDGTFYIGCQRLDLNISGGTWTAATRRLTKTGAFASYTWESGDQVYLPSPSPGTGHTAGWYSITSKIDSDTIELEPATGLSASDNTDTVTDAIGSAVSFTISTPGVGAADMYDVALNIQSAARAAGGVAKNVCVSWEPGYSGGYFRITSPYRGSSCTMFPPVYVSGYNHPGAGSGTGPFGTGSGRYVITAGTGSPTADTIDIEDRWSRQTPPNQPEAVITATKMPVRLTRTAVGNHTTPATFSCDVIPWSSRTSGDENSNKLPQFIKDGKKIADITRFRDRLGFGAGEHLFFGQAGDYYNLFADNAANAVDSDPIALRMSGERITEAAFLVPYRKTLIVFTKAGKQFECGAADAFTPTTAALTPSTAYYTKSGARPAPSSDSILFAGKHNDVNAILEYRYYDTQASNAADDITPHVPLLIPDTLRRIVTSPNDGVAIVLPDEGGRSGTTMYLYQTLRDQERDVRVQSAWTKIGFDGVPISDVAMIGSNAYVLLYADAGWVIEVFGVGPSTADSGPLDPNFIEDDAPAGCDVQAVITINGTPSIGLSLESEAYTVAGGTATITQGSGGGIDYPIGSDPSEEASYSYGIVIV